MPDNPYSIPERRRLRRKLTFWRASAFVILLVAIGLFALSSSFFGDKATIGKNHIARINISGVIVDDRELLERLEKVKKSDAAKAVVISINSPGGTTFGGERVFEAIRDVAAEKPVVAEIRTLATSAGYMIATAGDHIVAGQSSIIGSIGVIFQYAQVSELLDRLGIAVNSIKSSPLKAEPSPFSEASPEAEAMIRSMIVDSYDWFVELVSQRRNMSRETTLALADGSIFTGRQALDNGLIDAIGGEEALRAWLADKDVSADLEILEWKKTNTDDLFGVLSVIVPLVETLTGKQLMTADEFLGATQQKLFLDGLVSVWHVGNEGFGQE